MKKLLFALSICLVSTTVNAQWYKLDTVLYSIDDTATYMHWYMINYPQSNYCYWSIVTDSNSMAPIREGNAMIPDSVINVWGLDDSVIPIYLISNKIWLRKE